MIDEHFDERLSELRDRRSGFPDQDRPIASLLDALAWIFKADAQVATVEATSKAARPMAEVKEAEQRLEEDELARAREALPDFEEGLRSLRLAGGSEMAFDSRDERQDRVADALIRYLVSTDFAAVRTEELGPEEFRYYISVDWPRLDALAARIGLRDWAEVTTS